MKKDEALRHLQQQIEAIEAARKAGRNSPGFLKWHRHTAMVIGKVFGEDHENVNHFNQISYRPSVVGSGTPDSYFDERFQKGIENVQAVLESMVAEVRDFWPGTNASELGATPGNAPPDDTTGPIHAVIVCALHSPELDKAFRTSGTSWTRVPATAADPNTYHTTTLKTIAGTELRVLAAAPNQMGVAASAVLATKLNLRFRPQVMAMVGIAAGIKKDTQGFGDILAADQTFDYRAGKLTSDGKKTEFLPDPRPFPINPRALAILKDWQRLRRSLDEIAGAWPAATPPTQLRLHVGPLATGSSVINAKGPVDEILRHWRKVVGLEMEAYGVHCACHEATEPAPIFLCFKSICDFAHDKEDGWQDYAAFTAASFTWHFLRAEWESLIPNDG